MSRTAVLGYFLFLLLKETFALSCEVGQYQKDEMCKECKTTCVKCISEFLCTECKAGFFGEACTRNCSESCFERRCVKETGDCLSCNKGYYQNETCKTCPENCTECKNIDECTNCRTGYTGNICQKTCVNCKPASGCSIVEGICNDGCKDGYSGLTCLERCSSTCHSCNRLNAKICTSCVEGKYGKNCEETCPMKCIDNSCSRDTGTCAHGCHNGFWGDQCEYVCPANCRGGTCLRRCGVCSDGCNGNFTGNKCLCPKSCDCDEDGACTKCEENSGYVCDRQCRRMCLNSICSLSTERKCFYGCRDRYMYEGRMCIQGSFDLECGVGQYQKDAKCKECTTTCAKCISEFLCTKCKAGFFGEACTKNCSEECLEKPCHQETGACSTCTKGFYFDETCKTCPENCTTCLNADECTECKTGYTGIVCEKRCIDCTSDSFQVTDDESSFGALKTSVDVLSALLFIMTGTVICLLCRGFITSHTCRTTDQQTERILMDEQMSRTVSEANIQSPEQSRLEGPSSAVSVSSFISPAYPGFNPRI